MNTPIEGNCFKYSDNIDTDVIIPARYLNTSDEKRTCFSLFGRSGQKFCKRSKKGDIIVAGENFGCGSSREHAPIAIKATGISVVIAKSFARIFFRNSINIGLPILEHPTLTDECDKGDRIYVDLKNGIVKNLTKNKEYKCAAFPEEINKLIQTGGLIEYTKQKLGVN